jgi:hypothetical protein
MGSMSPLHWLVVLVRRLAGVRAPSAWVTSARASVRVCGAARGFGRQGSRRSTACGQRVGRPASRLQASLRMTERRRPREAAGAFEGRRALSSSSRASRQRQPDRGRTTACAFVTGSSLERLPTREFCAKTGAAPLPPEQALVDPSPVAGRRSSRDEEVGVMTQSPFSEVALAPADPSWVSTKPSRRIRTRRRSTSVSVCTRNGLGKVPVLSVVRDAERRLV